MTAAEHIHAYDSDDLAIAALETLQAKFAEPIAQLRRNEVFLLFSDMDDAQFAEFTALNVPALMAWCSGTAMPAGASFGIRRVHTQLAANESLLTYCRDAASETRRLLATPSWEIREVYDLRAQRVYLRLQVFLEQLEKTGAFPAELSRDALFEPRRVRFFVED